MAQLRATLPQPPQEYDPSYERRRNQRIEEMLNQKLDRLQAPVFGGIPLGILSGTNTDFTANKNQDVLMPFNTKFVDNGELIRNGSFIAPFEMVAMMHVSLFNKTGSQNKENNMDFNVYEFGGATPVASFSVSQEFYANTYIQGTGIALLPASTDKLELEIVHDAAMDIVIDMTKSTFTFMQLTINPVLVDSIRLSTLAPYNTDQPAFNPIGHTVVSNRDVSRFSLTKDYKP